MVTLGAVRNCTWWVKKKQEHDSVYSECSEQHGPSEEGRCWSTGCREVTIVLGKRRHGRSGAGCGNNTRCNVGRIKKGKSGGGGCVRGAMWGKEAARLEARTEG